MILKLGVILVILNLIIISMLTFGCAINPKYDDKNHQIKLQQEKYPQNREQIRTYQKDLQASQNAESIKPLENSYIVVPVKESSTYLGDPEAVIGIGASKHHYLHKISLTLFCGKFEFQATKYRNRNVKWFVGGGVEGEAATDGAGKINIIFNSESDEKIRQLKLITLMKTYIIQLSAPTFVELEKNECESRDKGSDL